MTDIDVEIEPEDEVLEPAAKGTRYSASRIKTWMDCSLQAHFHYDLKLPDTANAKAVFGTCIHAALELYNTTGNLEAAIEMFKDLWHNPEKVGAPVETLVWPKMTNYGGLRDRGIAILKDVHARLQWDGRDMLAAEHRFLVPFGDYELTGVVDLLEVRKTGKGKNILRVVDYKTASKQPNTAALALDIQFCADEATEILTRRGWKRHDEIIVGEDVLTLNVDTDLAEWQPAEHVNTFPTDHQMLVSIEGKAHSSLTTKNHRWPVEHVVSGQHGWRREKRITTSERLTHNDRIKCAAPVTNLPTTPKYDDAFVELVGWYWTEGEFRPGGQGAVSQSETANPQNVARIRAALTSMFGPAVTSMRSGKIPGAAAWRESSENGTIRFHLNTMAAAPLRSVCEGPKKVVAAEFISSLTTAQLHLFIDASIAADGSMQNACRLITQSERERLDAFQMACSLAGIRTVLREGQVGGNGRYAGRRQWSLALKERRPCFVPDHRVEVEHTGTVWCPTTRNETWLARRNGTVYFTGNTIYLFASMQREFWVGNGPDFPGLPNGEWLYETLKDMPRRAIWYALWTQKEIDAGPRDDADFMRLYQTVQQIERATQLEVWVPHIGEACQLCAYANGPCPVEIPTRADLAADENAWL